MFLFFYNELKIVKQNFKQILYHLFEIPTHFNVTCKQCILNGSRLCNGGCNSNTPVKIISTEIEKNNVDTNAIPQLNIKKNYRRCINKHKLIMKSKHPHYGKGKA